MNPNHSPNLYALVIKLTATNRASVRQTEGRLAHAAFLDMLQQVEPPVSAEQHLKNMRRDFTISSLIGFRKGRDNQFHFQPGDSGWLRITLLKADLFQTFISYFLYNNSYPSLKLHGAHFAITEIVSNHDSHDWAGASSLEELWDGWNSAEISRLPRKIDLQFASPTSFSRKRNHKNEKLPHRYTLAIPDSPSVFGSLAGTWKRLTGDESQDNIRSIAYDHITVAQLDICTRMNDYGDGKRNVGFQGRVTFEILGQLPDSTIRHIHRLADLAFFTGVGGKTTQGMGQVRKV